MTDHTSAHLNPEFHGDPARVHLKALQNVTWSLVRDVLEARNPNSDLTIDGEMREAREALLDRQIEIVKRTIVANIDSAQRHGCAASIAYVHYVTIMLRVLEAL